MKTRHLLGTLLTLGFVFGMADLVSHNVRGRVNGTAVQNLGSTNPNRTPKLDGTGGPAANPLRTPKLDGTGGPGKPASPVGPQNGTGRRK